jgi:hypothetical protein
MLGTLVINNTRAVDADEQEVKKKKRKKERI